MKIEIEEVMNGYIVHITKPDSDRNYVFGSTDDFKMLDFIGKELLGFKVRTDKI